MSQITRLLAALIVIGLLIACGAAPTSPALSLINGETLAPIDPRQITGVVEITGSSTAFPLTGRIADEFHAEGSRAQITIKVTGTGGGLRSFCNGDPVAIVNASRPISDEEIAACRAVNREPVGFPVGIDALAVVVHPQNTFVDSLTFEQLARIFTGQATSWDQVDPSYPAQPITVYSPGVDSGTFDYFVEEVLGGQGASLEKLVGAVLSEDDTELVRGIENNPNAIGYFGYAYYEGEGDRLRAIPIDDGSGPVAPGPDAVAGGAYPLARPLFVYSSEQTLKENPAAAAFLSYYLQVAHEVVEEVGYFPAAPDTIADAQQALVAALE